jgi:hypothetical protein
VNSAAQLLRSAERIALMAIPKEFAFASEDDFIQRFLIPLLHRLGFSVVANYHRTRGELGKDLVFAEIDRFGHIRYCGLQAKYEQSIGLSAVETLIQDCRQAFANPFNHPHTHTEERIQTFYAVNGGSISDDARQHFFGSVGHPLATCTRILDGKSLLALDRWAAANRSLATLPDLNGLLLEIRFNRNVSGVILPLLERSLQSQDGVEPSRVMTNPVFPKRFRVNATAQYLQRPFFVEAVPPEQVEAYWENLRRCNALLDGCTGIANVGIVTTNVKGVVKTLPVITEIGDDLAAKIADVLQTLGPLAAP